MEIDKNNPVPEEFVQDTAATVNLPGEEGGETTVAINPDGSTELNPQAEPESTFIQTWQKN